jgi:two-component system sensor histidine kinase TctE
MPLASWRRLSLKRALLLVLLPGMLLATTAELFLSWRTALDGANAAYDRSLLGAIKAIDANISTASGGLSVEMPYRMLEFFQLTASGEVYFSVATEDGLVQVGSPGLPLPAHPLVSGRPQFADALYFGERVRVGSYARALSRPLGDGSGAQRVVIQVAESIRSRSDFSRALLLQSFGRDVMLILIGAAMLTLVVGWALKPLQRLRNEVRSRHPQDLAPIAADHVPADVVPLVDAINHHLQRSRDLVERQRRFVDDASHQLRTPLATLCTQVAYALRESDPQRVHGALSALRLQLEDTVRRTNQMLALARADSAELDAMPLELNTLAETLTREWWSAARERQIDLGFEPAPGAVMVRASEGMLHEALGNLLHNAVTYAPQGGHVTVRVVQEDGQAVLAVVDDGPGIPPAERGRAGERFFRASNAGATGSGLGLAIVRSIAQRLDGTMQVDAGPHGQGCRVAIRLPLCEPDSAMPSTA